MKKTLLTISFLFAYYCCFSQVNFNRFAIGAGAGATISYTDVKENSQSIAFYATADYNITPFVQAGIEFQAGQLKGGDIVTDIHNRQFKNNYKTLTANTKISLGQFIDYDRNNFLNAIKGMYAGVGLGAILNNMKYIVRYKPNTQAQYPPLGYEFPGKDKSVNLLMPVNIGINFFIRDGYGDPRYMLNINYQGNLTFGEGMDGYDDPQATFSNGAPDIYSYISIGLKVNFGPRGVTKRTL